MKYTVIAYASDLYLGYLDRLENSLKKNKIPYKLYRIPQNGSDRRGIGLKRPSFVQKGLLELKSPVLYVDADTIFTGVPKIPDNLDFDIGITKRVNNKGIWTKRRGLENWNFASIFNYTDNTLNFVKEWKKLCDNRKAMRHGDHFRFNIIRRELKEKYKEIHTNQYFKKCIVGYIDGGHTPVQIREEK